ncbi:hypothetical protein thalar_01524 [Litoreibacter arenae DSM 19593]|uniref:Uncharacterized protein n=1 Tax=Litoreibacter arenae DSM 19593 TaxID=1123360 RepID=S9RQ51_9RHOB|nr:hypothetical protein thalar_01524 [Litoreibacter arenae DSM 19593]
MRIAHFLDFWPVMGEKASQDGTSEKAARVTMTQGRFFVFRP